MAYRLTLLALRSPRLVLLALGLLTAVAAAGTPFLHSVSYLESSLEEADPERARYAKLEQDFGSDHIVILAIGCGAPRPCRTVFDREPIDLVTAISDVASELPGVEAIESLATAAVLVGDGAALRTEQLPDEDDRDTDGLKRFQELVLRDPTLLGTLLSRDQRTTAVVVRFEADLPDHRRIGSAGTLIRDATALARAAGFELHVSGDVGFTTLTDSYVRSDLAYLTPIMLGLLAALLAWVLRDPRLVLLAMATSGVPGLWVFGLMGWLDRPISPISSMLPILILIVGVTDAMHFIVRVLDRAKSGDTADSVIQLVAREVGPPTTVTAATAALGFLSLLAGRIPSVRDFGLFAAIGIGAGWVLTFTLTPIVIRRIGLSGSRPRSALPAFSLGDWILDEMRSIARRRAGTVLVASALLTVLAVHGVVQIVPENDPLKIIGSEDLLARSEQFISERLRPTASIEVVYSPPVGTRTFGADTLARLENLEAYLSSESGGSPVVSALPLLRIANRELVTDHLELPSSPDAAAQLLLILELANPEGVHRVVTPDGRAVRFSVAYDWSSGSAIEADLARIRREVDEILGEGGSREVTGSVFLAAHMGDLVLSSQLASFGTAFLTIFLVIFLFIRSIPLGFLGIVPNAFPVVLILGLMGYAGINLDVATAMIASIILGISVDDTVYFLMHYRNAREGGANVHDAIALSFARAGKPALFCTLILATGFLVLGLSQFQSLAVFGVLSSLAVLIAGASELFLMPAILEWLDRRTRDA